MALLIGPISGQAEESGLACSDHVVFDYAAPLRKMAPIPTVPRNGRLPFAPRGVALFGPTNPVRPGAGPVGFELVAGPVDQAWANGMTARSSIFLVDRRGNALRRVEDRRLAVDHTLRHQRDVYKLGRFNLPARPAFYRLDIEFVSSTGKPLGRYGEYLRVVPERRMAVLSISGSPLSPGAQLFWRVENRGTVGVSAGLHASIEQWNGVSWVGTDLFPAGAPMSREVLPGGTAGRCQFLTLPESLAPGEYRVRKAVDIGERSHPRFARFTVT